MNQHDPHSDAPLDGPDSAAELNEADGLRAELAKVRDEALRERAELDNQRKRLARDIDMARKFANERLLGDLLPVIDSLEAGLAAAGGDAGALREGMELTLRQLLKVAADNGLVAVDPAGQPFNPEHHQAMSMVPAPGVAPGHVVQVYQKGWLLNERLLRPALVVVSQDA
ncbi:nucleotide exchange factor GrpE [Lysobacter silvisoli]|uniref:Protein GrpE n=1 Tax=Lysobacter silvisoli TaxID=2293254 RepID=A0A371K461_9GAMM|nr:nucleotide exchange factor GrpE [Lysobacter silvisoli]RDZ28652.1 nucleotide exchange factor GrpE [Lysobacter silvisoli]